MIQAYIVYLLLMFCMLALWSLQLKVFPPGSRASVNWRVSFLILVITVFLYGMVIGLRYNVGGDFQGYVKYYESITNHMSANDVPYEWGLFTVNRILRSFDFPPAALFIVLSGLQIFFISLWMRRHAFLAPWYIYFFFTCLLFFESMNTIRQALAYTCVLAAMPLLLERRLIRFTSMVFFASLFHKSAMLFLPLYFILDKDWILSPRWQITLLLLSITTADILKDYLFDLLPYLAISIGYESYAEFSELLLFEGEARGLSAGLVFIIMVDIFVMISSPMLRKRFAANGFRIYYNLYLIGALLTPVVLSANYIPFQRLAFYFTAFKPVVLAFLMYAVLGSKIGRHPTTQVLAFSVVILYFLWFLLAIENKAAWSAPFQFVGQ